MKTPRDEYYRKMPRKYASAGVLFFREGRLLVLEPTYKPGLEIPGGVLDKDESFLEAAQRECREEIGVKADITQLLCIDYRRDYSADKLPGDSAHYIFLGDMGSQPVSIDYDEIGGFKWMPVPEALAEMSKHRPDLAARVKAAVSVMSRGQTAYCEDGKMIFPLLAAPKAAPKIKPPKI